ncbi:protein of unknown function (DU1801) [Devosia lucknowensis]|uniref:YdhG-like domain-containing protein n=1 Tax=Devosia lucknowensis TaxID=1096929 RepID=A0A1Y6EPJ5_9HYPH|nr:DUF1801 domain-containing protein [Devosia lucknowensis]SMQ64615.1 protein of unknown function (DU1801) [Devosia lucknowensis]
MAEQKTKPHSGDVDAYLAQIEDPTRRADSRELLAMMADVSGHEPVLWGTMVGFGQYHYRYASGHEWDAFRIGFAPRKGDISLYLLGSDAPDGEPQASLLARLGKHKAGKSCLYVKRLADIDHAVLRELTVHAYARMQKAYPE